MKRLLNIADYPILGMPRVVKRIVMLVVDLSFCILTTWLAYCVRLNDFISVSAQSAQELGINLATHSSILLALPIFIFSGLYRAIFRHSGFAAFLAVVWAIGVYGLLYACIFTIVGFGNVPRIIGILQPLLLLVVIAASRLFVLIWLGGSYKRILKKSTRSNVIIYGAGRAGRQLAATIRTGHKMNLVAYIDDDNRLQGQLFDRVPIFSPKALSSLVNSLSVDEILLAMPSISRSHRNKIINQIQSANVSVRSLPSLDDIIQGMASFSELQELNVDDLLGREPVPANALLLGKNIEGKVVAITGAGGSIGSEICRQCMALRPKKLLLIEQNEYSLFKIQSELNNKFDAPTALIFPLLASIQDEFRIEEIISTWKPDTLFHAAAYKHLPIVELNQTEGIKNNVFGTLCLVKVALKYGVSNFVLISTDKAVRPTSLMGGSKRLAELILQSLADLKPMTKFSIVRFGNVLESSGSVVPEFRRQIKDGGPIKLTDPEVTRYFMSIREAAQLVLQAGTMAEGGDVFVLDMGKPIRIIDLARRMVELAGLRVKDEQNPQGDIEIEIIGLRTGEKLHEELLIGNNPQSTDHSGIFKAQEKFIPWPELEGRLNTLRAAANVNDSDSLRQILFDLVDSSVNFRADGLLVSR